METVLLIGVCCIAFHTVGGGAHGEMAGSSSTAQSTAGGTLQFHHGRCCIPSRVSAHPLHPEQPGRVSSFLR